MKTVIIRLCIFLAFIPINVVGQTQEFLEAANEQTVELTDVQEKLLEVIRSRPQTQGVRLVTIPDLENFNSRASIRLNLFDSDEVIVQKRKATFKNDETIVWEGKSDDPTAAFTFVVSGNKVTGFMMSSSFNYAIEPLKGGLHALIKIDATKFLPEGEPVKVEEDDNGRKKSNAKVSSSNEIDVLVAYTYYASLYSGDIDGLIYASESFANQSFSNSTISASINVVGKVQVDYSESGNTKADLYRLTASPTFNPWGSSWYDPEEQQSYDIPNYLDDIHTVRDEFGADLVLLLIGYGNSCGIAFLPSSFSTAFSVVKYDCAGSGLTFSHEIGHNLGAAHDIPHASVSAYPYGHGYKDYNWRTIMASNLLSENRINYWSNPDIEFGFPGYEVPMGTVQYEDNARVWSERVATVAGFNAIGPSVSISGPSSVETNETETWYSNVSDGVSPYSYKWYKSTNGGSSWSQIGTSANYTGSFSTASNLKLKVEVTDDNSKTDEDIKNVVVTDGGCIMCKVHNLPGEFTLQHNYPNPFNPSTQIEYALPEGAEVSIRVFNIMGQQVATLLNETRSAGYHQVHFEAGNLSSGIYIARMEAVGESGQQFTHELKMQLIK